MNNYQQILDEFYLFLMDIRNIDSKMFEYGISFDLKMFSLREMHLRTLEKAKELEEVQKKESAQAKAVLDSGRIFIGKETTIAYKKSVAYFEAYLNALYSLLQIITKITLLVFQKSKTPIATQGMGDNFGSLVNYLKTHPNVDSDFSDYINQKMGWYVTFKNNRRKITHDGSALLLFTQNDEIEFLDYPKNGKGFGSPNINKQGLENYMKNQFNDLFGFLDFYVKHFRQRLAFSSGVP